MTGTTNSGASAPAFSTQAVEQTARDVLVAARKLIELPEHWSAGWSATRHCHCAVQACVRATPNRPLAYEAVYALADVIGVIRTGPAVGDWNDTHTHDEVLAAFDRAIAAANVLKNDPTNTTEERAS